MIKSSAKLWLGIGVLSFCVSSAAARAQQQNPFIGMLQGLDLSPMNVRAVPCNDFAKNDCSNFNALNTVRVDGITPSISNRVGKQIRASVDAFVEKAASRVKATAVQRVVGQYDNLFGYTKAIAMRELTAIRLLLWI